MRFQTTARKEKLKENLITLLRSAAIGETIEYRVIEAVIGGKIAYRRHLLYAAIKALNESDGIVFENVKGRGYQRIIGSEIASVGSKARSMIGRKARRAVKTMKNALRPNNALDQHERHAVFTEIGMLNMAALAVNGRRYDTVADIVERANFEKPPTAQMLINRLRG